MTDITHGVEDVPSDRAQHLLRTLIECYVRDGQPVGSRTLTRESGMNLSAATIRNVMADLEEHGFVSSPHTSAGRVPTDLGFRMYVDGLLELGHLSEDDRIAMQDQQARSNGSRVHRIVEDPDLTECLPEMIPQQLIVIARDEHNLSAVTRPFQNFLYHGVMRPRPVDRTTHCPEVGNVADQIQVFRLVVAQKVEQPVSLVTDTSDGRFLHVAANSPAAAIGAGLF